MTTQLSSMPEGLEARLKQCGQLMIELKKHTSQGMPVVLTGDFNDVPTSEPIQSLLNEGSPLLPANDLLIDWRKEQNITTELLTTI